MCVMYAAILNVNSLTSSTAGVCRAGAFNLGTSNVYRFQRLPERRARHFHNSVTNPLLVVYETQ